MPRTALYTGTFDPVTNGHLDVVRARLPAGRPARDRHRRRTPRKAPLFTADERAAMLREVCGAGGVGRGSDARGRDLRRPQRRGRAALRGDDPDPRRSATAPISTTRCRWPA